MARCGDAAGSSQPKWITVTDITAPKVVQVETVKMVPEIMALPDPPEEKPVAKRKLRYVEHDVCIRHGMHKALHPRRTFVEVQAMIQSERESCAPTSTRRESLMIIASVA